MTAAIAPSPFAASACVPAATERAYLARRLGTALRERRTGGTPDAGAQSPPRRRLAARGEPARARPRARGTGIDVWAACGAALDLQLAAFFEQAAGASLPRDIEHLRRQNLVLSISAKGGWTAIPEASVDPGRWSRSIDVLLERAARREAAVVEIWDLLLDGGEAMRGLESKVQAVRERLGGAWQRAGPARRARHAPEPRARAGARATCSRRATRRRPAAWLARARRTPATPMPGAGGFAWTSVDGTRLVAARL